MQPYALSSTQYSQYSSIISSVIQLINLTITSNILNAYYVSDWLLGTGNLRKYTHRAPWLSWRLITRQWAEWIVGYYETRFQVIEEGVPVISLELKLMSGLDRVVWLRGGEKWQSSKWRDCPLQNSGERKNTL